jgi:hypothetical protein
MILGEHPQHASYFSRVSFKSGSVNVTEVGLNLEKSEDNVGWKCKILKATLGGERRLPFRATTILSSWRAGNHFTSFHVTCSSE